MNRKFKKSFLRLVVIAVGLFFIIPAVWNLIFNLYKIYMLNLKRDMLREENLKLQRQISEASTDEYIEKIARVNLGLKKDGEIEYRFVSQQSE